MNGTERKMTIYEMRVNGATFADIAREFGISTERARQIYVAHKAMEERDDTPMYKALCEAAEDAGRPYPERAASRAYHCLALRGITELAQLADYSDAHLLCIHSFGAGSLEIARAAQAKAANVEAAQVEEPINQREEIVRCRDCEFFVRDRVGECCTLMDFGRAGGMADGFCAWGERKEANE